jgi:glycosyltransferase involved in cell wall biosynthesis
MRILIASGTWYPDKNGVARVASEVGRRLADRGHEVTAVVPRAPNLSADEQTGSLRVLRVIRRGALPLLANDVVETTRRSRGLGRIDVVLAHGSAAAVGLSRAGLGAPLLLVYHASLPRELRFMRSRLPWGRERLLTYLNEPIAYGLDRVGLGRCDRILALSAYSRSLLVTDHADHVPKIRAVSGGVETSTFCPLDGMRAARLRLGADATRRLLVTVRRAEPRMGIEQLLGAIRIMADDDVDLAVVGGGLLTGELRHLASEFGVDGRVRFVGRVSEAELHDWYRAADLFVLPTVAYEGFGMVTVEALASGTPVVGTSAGATPELLEPLDMRLVAQGSEPESLAAAIRRTLAFVDDDFRAHCRQYAKDRFDWDRVIPIWEEALANAVSLENRSWAGQRRFPNGYPQYP